MKINTFYVCLFICIFGLGCQATHQRAEIPSDQAADCEKGDLTQWRDPYFFHMARITKAKFSRDFSHVKLDLIINQNNYPGSEVSEVIFECGFLPQIRFRVKGVAACVFYQPVSVDAPDLCHAMMEFIYRNPPTTSDPLCFFQNNVSGDIDDVEKCIDSMD